MAGFELPAAPAELNGAVKAWSRAVVIPTYEPMEPDKNPMFLEKRVYQGSSGKVYPLPFIDRISEQKIDRTWEAIHLENEFLRVMILPELGGRIHVALDKTSGYDFIYRQNVIKPALVGLAGPWISGGIEFNWPQHHRPSTFMPVTTHIEEHADGSRTVWLSEHEPMNRMKGMHGVCLHPGKAYIELKARLYNRTPLVQTFLWWANVATRVHEKYQSFFPPDVRYVADHARRAMSSFPRCAGFYYGVDYAKRARDGVPAEEMPRQFAPGGEYGANNLSWYANIPVPTSYMCMGTEGDFFGGYDHAAGAGIVHVANHHISPGKKQWTWGNHEFGYAWDRNLTDKDGPYIEIMAGVYTDNQPDFSFLHPFETRTFSQFWFPIQRIGPASAANLNGAISLKVENGSARVGVVVTEKFSGASVVLEAREKIMARWEADLTPGEPRVWTAAVNAVAEELKLSVRDGAGAVLIEFQLVALKDEEVPAAATEPALPEKIESADELYLTGLHLEQYRHATRSPMPYWREALKRIPRDVRCNNAMGLWHLRRGEFGEAERHFAAAVEMLTHRNPNPYDGEAYYNLGLARRWLGKDHMAYAAFYKATWNYAWQSAAFYALAEMDCRRGNWAAAIEHLDRSLKVNADHLKARDLKAIVLRKLRREAAAEALLAETLSLDPLDEWAKELMRRSGQCDLQMQLDVAFNFAAAGFFEEAIGALRGDGPMVHYAKGCFLQNLGRASGEEFAAGAAAKADYCFPSRLEEMVVLEATIAANPFDAKAHYYLGNFYYDRRRHEEAIGRWEKSASLDSSFSIVWRNLGIGYHNIRRDGEKAREAYERAISANPNDARLWYERDQLWKRLGESSARRLAELETRLDLVARRDDLSIELAALFNQMGRHEEALKLVSTRKFQPWEGGEGQALGQFVRTHLALGRKHLVSDAETARPHFELALQCPENLGEARHLLANQSDVYFWLGLACQKMRDATGAKKYWQAAARSGGDFQEMSIKRFSEMSYYRAMALHELGQGHEADELLRGLLEHAEKLADSPAEIDYFATSLPTMLIFEDDLPKRQTIVAMFLMAQAYLGLGDRRGAIERIKKVLEMDCNHAMAGDLLAELSEADVTVR